MLGRTGKLYFTENEAARILGVSVDQFRTLLTQHICKAEDVSNSSQTTFHASDIVLLKMFVGQLAQTAAQQDAPPGQSPQTVSCLPSA